MQTAQTWLKENGYEDVAQIITEILLEWKKNGIKTRRNWWDYLCGDKKGNRKKVAGRELPVLRAAQIRQGVPITKSAICRNENETPPSIWENTKWNKQINE